VSEAPDTAQELRARALRLLARREHSRAELKRKLGPHAESADAIEVLLDALEEKKQLSDARYASERAHVLTRRFGASRIRQELRSRGVDETIAEGAAAAAAETDLERARAIYQRRYREPAATREERAKRSRFLQGRGFSGDIIRRLVSGDAED
jgi:regulatory protein